MHRLQELVRLHRMGQPTRQIVRTMGMGPNTERRYRQILADAGLLDGDVVALPELEALRVAVEAALPVTLAPQETSTVDRWRGDIERLLSNRSVDPMVTGSHPAAIRRRDGPRA